MDMFYPTRFRVTNKKVKMSKEINKIKRKVRCVVFNTYHFGSTREILGSFQEYEEEDIRSFTKSINKLIEEAYEQGKNQQ